MESKTLDIKGESLGKCSLCNRLFKIWMFTIWVKVAVIGAGNVAMDAAKLLKKWSRRGIYTL